MSIDEQYSKFDRIQYEDTEDEIIDENNSINNGKQQSTQGPNELQKILEVSNCIQFVV